MKCIAFDRTFKGNTKSDARLIFYLYRTVSTSFNSFQLLQKCGKEKVLLIIMV